jgi:hypothetical protein
VFLYTLGSIWTSRPVGFAQASRNAGREMGYEVAANLRTHLSGPLNLDSGVALAHLGRFFGTDPRRIYEVFSRLQLQY